MTASDDPGAPDQAPALATLLERHRGILRRLVERRAGSLLRCESADDLVQGIHLHVLQVADRFEYRGDRAFVAWIAKVAAQHIGERRDYWRALRRNAGRMLRLTGSDPESAGTRGVDPAGSATGPATMASRREQLALAVKALGTLFPRDRDLVRWIAEDVPVGEVAARLGISYESAKRRRQRALERFRRMFELVTGQARDPTQTPPP